MTDESVFAHALALPVPDRAAFLSANCPDPAVRKQVVELLAAHDASNPLDHPPPDLDRTNSRTPTAPEPTAAVGDRVGQYRLLEKIGEGGMGEVWVADQQEPIKRRVAIKLIKPGMDSRSVLGRFEAERQALAVMDHPNIAKVLDAGYVGESSRHTPCAVGGDGTRRVPATLGRPFFVMELVKGTPITEFADARKLTPKQRLELFVPVCQAIQHAHMKGIIHRDIKPSNVLVALHDETPVPKVIDFGVAKAVGQQLTDKTIYTGFGALVGTPAYMAPEQAAFNQLDIDTRADVYALGVLLYELLAGSPPIEKERLKKAALDEMLRLVREEEPPRPSHRLSTSQAKATIAAVRGTEPAKLSALMKGELDWIVMKALEKDRTRRYETANGFAADIQRYLSGEPVQAVPPSLGYRVKKFVRKHRGPVIAAAVVAAAVLLGVAGTTGGMVWALGAERQAVEERNKAERERGNAVDAQADAEAARKAAERKANAAAVDLDLKFCDVEPPRGVLRLAQRLKTLPPDATELRQFVTLSLFVHAQRLARLVPYKEPLAGISPDGRVGFRVQSNGVAELVHPITGARLALLAEKSLWAQFRFSPDGRFGALVLDHEVRVYDLRTCRQTATLRPGGPADWQVVLAPTFSRAVVWRQKATGGIGPTHRADFQLWDVNANRRLTDLHNVEWAQPREYVLPEELCVFSPDGRTLLTVGERSARVWSATDGRLLHTLAGHTADPRVAAFSPDGKTAVTGSTREVQWWRTEEWKRDGPPTLQVVEGVWTKDERDRPLWPQARMLTDGVLAVAVRNSDDFRDGSTDYLYVHGEPAAHRHRGVASDGRVAIDLEGVFSLRPFRVWESADGRQFPAEYRGPLIDHRFLLLHSDLLPFGRPDRLIDLACDRRVGELYDGLVPCAAPGCRFVSPFEGGYGRHAGRPTVVLPAPDAPFDPDVMELWAKVLTCGELNPVSGFFEQYDEPTWERKRQELLHRAKPVGEFPFPGAFAADRLHWLRNQVEQHDKKLLVRLVDEEPTAENYRTRSNYWLLSKKYDLALRDDLAAEELERKAGVPIPLSIKPDGADQIVYNPDGPRESYEVALRWLDTRSNRDQFRGLRGLALYRLGRHQEALDLLLEDERVWFHPRAAVIGPPALIRPNEQRTLTIGLCLLKLGQPAEAAARLEQARAEHRLRAPAAPWPHLNADIQRFFLVEAEATIRVKVKPPEPKK